MTKFTHFDDQGKAHMVNISNKEETRRIAIARGEVLVDQKTLKLIETESIGKGDVLGVARLAGIMGAKNTSGTIPLCHPLQISSIEIDFQIQNDNHTIIIEAKVTTVGKTGVEMEALVGVSVAALTIYDMVKSVDKGVTINNIHLAYKEGGKSGAYVAS